MKPLLAKNVAERDGLLLLTLIAGCFVLLTMFVAAATFVVLRQCLCQSDMPRSASYTTQTHTTTRLRNTTCIEYSLEDEVYVAFTADQSAEVV